MPYHLDGRLTDVRRIARGVLAVALCLAIAGCSDDDDNDGGALGPDGSEALPSHDDLLEALDAAVSDPAGNGGFGLNMWATVVDRSGIVRAISFTGTKTGDQWPGSRVISAQKANTANAFSLTGLALSTANLFTATQPGGSLFGLQESNPVNTEAAYGGNADDYGTESDFMLGRRIGGVNVFGGGLALYDASGEIIGAIGVSGDSSCADHNIAWKVRDALGLDLVPGGVSPTGDDNIIYDIGGDGVSESGFGHPECSPDATTIGVGLPSSHPTGP
ncbi:heme-binding protein [soil metagenome]